MRNHNDTSSKKEEPTIGMLLDVEHFYGEHEGRIMPVILTIIISGMPILLYVYFSLFTIIPVWVFMVFHVIFSIRVIAIVLGRENYRLKIYKRQLFDDYTAASDLVTIKTIHDDGCIEYTTGIIQYLVVCLNGTTEDKVRHSVRMRRFIESLTADYMFDVYIHNINTTPSLTNYYDKVHHMGRTEVASNFIEIVDLNKQRTEEKSKVQRMVFAIYGRRSDWKNICTQIDSVLASDAAKVFKTAYRVSTAEEAIEIIDRDTDTNVRLQHLMRMKHRSGDYDSSKVLGYDSDDSKIYEVNKQVEDSGKIKYKDAKSFHVKHNNGA